MMSETKVLVCAATRMEMQAFWRDNEAYALADDAPFCDTGDVAYLVSGVGIPWTFSRLIPLLTTRLHPALILNIGIAGAYPESGLEIGDIAIASSEMYGDIGFELPEEPGFQALSASPLGRPFYADPIPLIVPASYQQQPSEGKLHYVRGCTVNSCSGTDRTGRLREKLFGASIETMEGAAVAQIGREAGIPVCEIRAISNISAKRDMRPENITLALARLQAYLRLCRA